MGDDQLEEEEALISASVTDEQLATLAGTTELASVTFLQLAVDSTHVPLGTIGERLPALEQLKLSGSNMPCIRELGTSLGALRVLWLSRCGLADLDGLSSLGVVEGTPEVGLKIIDCPQLTDLKGIETLGSIWRGGVEVPTRRRARRGDGERGEGHDLSARKERHDDAAGGGGAVLSGVQRVRVAVGDEHGGARVQRFRNADTFLIRVRRRLAAARLLRPAEVR